MLFIDQSSWKSRASFGLLKDNEMFEELVSPVYLCRPSSQDEIVEDLAAKKDERADAAIRRIDAATRVIPACMGNTRSLDQLLGDRVYADEEAAAAKIREERKVGECLAVV